MHSCAEPGSIPNATGLTSTLSLSESAGPAIAPAARHHPDADRIGQADLKVRLYDGNARRWPVISV